MAAGTLLVICYQCQCNIGQCTEVRFASFLSGGFTTISIMNPPKKKLKKRTSVQCSAFGLSHMNVLGCSPQTSYSVKGDM